MKKVKKKIIIVIMIVSVLLIILGMLFLRLCNGVKLTPTKDYPVPENIVLYRQDNVAWAQDKLGESDYNMESSGCLVSCIASAVTMNGADMTPGELNALFSERAVYDAEGNTQWGQITEMEGYYAEVYTEVSTHVLEACLEVGKYPIVRVRMHGLGNYHYVLIVGAEDGEYICMDPLEDELTKLSAYGNRVYAIRCVWYEDTKLAQLYEKFLNFYGSYSSWNYAYHDSNGDGTKELYILQTNYQEPCGYIVRYQNHGLQFCYQEKFSEEICKKLEWQEMPEATDTKGIDVYVKQFSFYEDSYWYADEESLLTGFGFEDAEPFHEYRDEQGVLRLLLYFNEQTGEGCGICYTGNNGEYMYGFTFDDAMKGEWTGFLTEYDKQISIEETTGEKSVKEYQEEFGYDPEGKLLKYASSGIYDDDTERSRVLELEYEYHNNGNLKYRHYYHNPWIFGTWYTTWDSYFDELGRVEYESAYITHGSLEYFYIYEDEDEKPEYVLVLDDNLGALIPEFTSY